ncbi:MAG: PAS domain S-box protein, partial [Deltaproteobacteria bacterium]|nr:PAS domain S-box protein [Deltaproteobacteria bacterium]
MAKPGRDELIQSNQALEKQLESSDMDSSARKMSKAFQIITEQSPNMIFINKGGRIVYVNRRCTQEMGYSKAEFCAPDFDFMTLIAPESVDLVQSNFVKNMQGQEVAPYEYQLITKKGKKIAAIITTKLIRYQGEAAILGIVTDISERKRAEEDLQYRLKFQNLITKVSSQFVNLYPAQIDDEIDRTLQQIGQFAEADRSYMFQFSDDQKSVSCTHEWCADQIEPTIARIQDAPVDSFQWAMNRFFSGQMLTIPRVADLPPEADSLKEELVQQGIQSVLAVPMIIGGKVIGFIGLDSVREEKMWVEDTSSILKIVGYVFANALENKKTRQALQESEERLRTVYETFPDPVTIIQAEDGRCIDVNSAFSRVTGWSATEVIGKTAAELDIWEDTAERQKLVDGIAEKGKIDNLEARFRL